MAAEDEGPGIDESKCGELSKAFVRMDSRYGGIGLGLLSAALHSCITGSFSCKTGKRLPARGPGTAEERSVRGKTRYKESC